MRLIIRNHRCRIESDLEEEDSLELIEAAMDLEYALRLVRDAIREAIFQRERLEEYYNSLF